MSKAVIIIIWSALMLVISQLFAIFAVSIAGASFTASCIGIILLVMLLGINSTVERARAIAAENTDSGVE